MLFLKLSWVNDMLVLAKITPGVTFLVFSAQRNQYNLCHDLMNVSCINFITLETWFGNGDGLLVILETQFQSYTPFIWFLNV